MKFSYKRNELSVKSRSLVKVAKMKLFIVVLLGCLGVALGQSAASKSLEATLNNLKEQMPCGFPDMGVPPLTPFKMDFFDLNQKLWIIKIYGAMKNLVVSGLNNYIVRDVNMNILSLKASFNIEFSNINVRGDLSLESWIVKFLKIKNSGDLNVSVKNLSVTIAVRFGMVDGLMKIMELTPTISLGGVECQSTGFVIGKLTMKIVNSIAQKVIMKVFKDKVDSIEGTIVNVAVPAANDYLKDMSITELLSMLTGPKEPTVCIPPAA